MIPGWWRRPTTRASSASIPAMRASPRRSGASTLMPPGGEHFDDAAATKAPPPSQLGEPPLSHPPEAEPFHEDVPAPDALAWLQPRLIGGPAALAPGIPAVRRRGPTRSVVGPLFQHGFEDPGSLTAPPGYLLYRRNAASVISAAKRFRE